MELLKNMRIKKGISQTELAKGLNTTQQAVAKWESGESMPRADKLPLLAKILGCTVDELLADIHNK